MCCVSLCLTGTSFLQMTSWVVLKFQWQKFEQNRKAKALRPADCCCTKSPLEKSGSALTCNFLNRKLSSEGLEKPAPEQLPTRLGLKNERLSFLGPRSITWLHPSQSLTLGSLMLLHTKLLAIYANMISPINRPTAQCLVLVLTCLAVLDAGVSVVRAIEVLCGNKASDHQMLPLGECVHCGVGDAGTIPHM